MSISSQLTAQSFSAAMTFLNQNICFGIYLFIYLFIYSLTYLFIYLFVCLFIYLSVHVSVLFICLFVYLLINLYKSFGNGAGPQQSFGACLGHCLEE